MSAPNPTPAQAQAQAEAMHKPMADAIRVLAMDAVEQAKSGHPGMPMGMADVATVLFGQFLKYDPAWPDWPDRDRFVLSAGHGSMLLYAVLHLTGYADMTMDQLRRFRQLGSRTAGHPEHGLTSGVETTTGPLGQGLGNGVGMALAERALAARFGADLVDHRTYVVAGDGCLMEGLSQEAISLAGHLRLARLIVLFDDNRISIDGPTALTTGDDQVKRFEASGWRAERVDGHDPKAIAAALARAQDSDRPSLIACRTVIGFGAPTKAGSEKSHGAPLGKDEIAGARAKLGWNLPPFELPAATVAAWRAAGARGASASAAWKARHARADAATRAEFDRRLRGDAPAGLDAAIARHKEQLAKTAPKVATRKASELALEAIQPLMPELIGGSADLTGSNNTKVKGMAVLSRDSYGAGYVHYGVREHAMAAAMNGMALHGGVVPYGGTFLVFTDYCRPSIRLAALMKQRVVYVMTHDSIGLGEDGPTHQPVEHLAALRAIPNLAVFRPCDAIETAECWALALARRGGPSVLVLTRQDVPAARLSHVADNLSARGGYELAPAKGAARATLLATGSEIAIALEAQAALQAEGIGARVVSLPSLELFAAQDQAYRRQVLGEAPARVAVEAGIRLGWDGLLGARGGFVGMSGFGASAPYPELYRHFGIAAAAVVEAAKAQL
ncbi:MAG: transketolase [Alphaproteobacteria bacterium]|nr:transketolase [Alphaproteobacteria bacterium]